MNDKEGYTVKIFSEDLQPNIANKYVPFYFEELCTEDNIKLREKYKGTPFR